MRILRTKKAHTKYLKDKETNACGDLWSEPAIYETENFRIITNKYPYDLIVDEHVLLLTKESIENAFKYAKEYAEQNGYYAVLWNCPSRQSVPSVTHLHILR